MFALDNGSPSSLIMILYIYIEYIYIISFFCVLIYINDKTFHVICDVDV